MGVGDVTVAADLTLQSVDLIDPRAGLTTRPENQPSVYGSVNVRFPLPFDVRAVTEARFTGSQFCVDPDTGADRELDAGTRLNVDLSRVFTVRPAGAGWISRLEARAGVDNVADTAIYDQCGLPQPGRLFRVQVRVF
jgi:iron complex outermembrane receptor protein